MNYTYFVPIIVVILLGSSLPDSLANKELCEIFTISSIENYTCNSIGDTVTFIPKNAMTAESDYIKNQILLNSTWDNGNIGQFDFIVFVNRTGYFAINGNSGESSSNPNFSTLMNRIIASDSSIFVKSGTYALDFPINLEPDMRIILDSDTIIQTSYTRIILDSDTIIQVPDRNIFLDSDSIILPQDDYDSKLDLQQLIGNEVDVSDEDFDLAEGYRNTAEASFDVEDFDEAITYYNKILTIIPTDFDALNGKAQSLENIGNYEEAITFYDKVLEIDSSDIDALNGKAIALENLGNLDEAISNLEKIVEQETPVEDEEEPVVNVPKLSSGDNVNEFEQTLFVIVTVFVVILISIIIIDFIVKKRTSIKKTIR
jgi:hypothetical protein